MATQTKPKESVRVPLSRDRVLRAAMDLADEAGIESLTMRRLAQELGCRGDVALLLRRQQGRHPERHRRRRGWRDRAPVAGDDWKPASAGWRSPPTRSSCATPGRPAWCCRPRESATPRLRYMDAILGTLREAGFSAEHDRPRLPRPGEPHHGLHAVGGRA